MIALLLLALALAMDAFAAALSQGAAARPNPTASAALRVGFAFGAAQAVMPLLGWSLGLAFESVIRDVDHWIAFILLTLLGGRMVRTGVAADDGTPPGPVGVYAGWALTAAAIATSVDAAAAGITIPLLGQPITVACAVIGGVACLLSTAGVLLGGACGVLIGRRAEIVGGVVLIGLGCKILMEHVFFDGG
jgi:putative Mn2+ efflux pump MntP